MNFATPFPESQEPDPASNPLQESPPDAGSPAIDPPVEASVETHLPEMAGQAIDQGNPPDNPEDEETWKQSLREEFEDWLASLDDLDDLMSGVDSADASDPPDLYSFFEQLAAANTESRKANRRTAEAFSQWGDTLERFDQELHRLRDQLNRLGEKPANTGALARAQALVLVGLFDRLQRLGQAFDNPPPKSWWHQDAAWRQAWATQRQAFDILRAHFQGFLTQEGIERLQVLDQPFDPARMTAVATEPDPHRPHHSVIAELSAGYRYQGELLIPAQVKVSLNL